MLVYVVTIATSAFFVPHYLSIFWEPLRENPWDVVVGIAVVIVVLVVLNIVGVQEAAKLNVFLAVVDFATQLLLVAARLRARLQTRTIARRQRPLGRRADLGRTSRSRSRSRCSRTPASRRSRTSPRRRATRVRSVPTSIRLVAIAVFAIYFTLPVGRALGAAGRSSWTASTQTTARAAAGGGRLRERPGARPRREPRPRTGSCSHAIEIYVGVLAATILFIATNAGVIGASRITYSMATLPAAPGASSAGCTRASRRRGSRSSSSPGVAPAIVILPGRHDLPRDALLLRRDALVHGRARRARRAPRCGRRRTRSWRSAPARTSAARGVDWPAVRARRRARDRRSRGS